MHNLIRVFAMILSPQLLLHISLNSFGNFLPMICGLGILIRLFLMELSPILT